MLRIGVLDAHVTAGDRPGHQVGACFDPVRQYLVVHAGELAHTLHDDPITTGTCDLCAHRNEKVRQVHDLRLACGVLDHGLTLCQRSSHHEVLGAGDRDGVQHQARTFQAICAGTNVASLDVNVRAH